MWSSKILNGETGNGNYIQQAIFIPDFLIDWYSLPDFLNDWSRAFIQDFLCDRNCGRWFFIFSLFMSIANTPAIAWDHGLYNYGPQEKPGPSSIFVNKVLLKHSHSSLLAYCLRILCTTMTELSNFNRDHLVAKPKIFTTIWSFTEKVWRLLS